MRNPLKKLRTKSEPANEAPLLTVTEAAKEKVLSIIEGEEGEVQGLRVSIQGRTASAFEYGLGLEAEAAADDLVVDAGTFKVFVDPESGENLQAATIDYIEGWVNDNRN